MTRAEQMCYLRNLSSSTATNTFFYAINELADGNPCHHNNDYKDQRFQVNEDGTISPDGKRTLVLGASKVKCEFDKQSGC